MPQIIPVDEIRKDFKSREDWFQRYQESLEKNEKHIEKILEIIDREVRDRGGADRALEERIKEVDKNITKYSKEAYKIAALVGTLGALIISLLIRFLTH